LSFYILKLNILLFLKILVIIKIYKIEEEISLKEATGELNMTVVTVVAIAALVAFFYLVIWPTIQVGMTLQSACSSYGNSDVTQTLEDGSTVVCASGSCTYNPANGGSSTTKTCN